jgi:hypothetical protein
MPASARPVHLDYAELSKAIRDGVYPQERSWIDFKRSLYPQPSGSGDAAAIQAAAEARARASLELAKDMASMAETGGWLVYGVREDKKGHAFAVVDMELPVGLHETVDQIARSRITPSLTVLPTLLPNPEDTTKGFLVIEIPESPDSPHMVEHTYWGRSDTGKMELGDDRIERLILARNRLPQRLAEEIKATIAVDPVPPSIRKLSHYYFTAVPVQGWSEMFASYSRDMDARNDLRRRLSSLAQEMSKADAGHERPQSTAISRLSGERRTQRPPAGWLNSWSGTVTEGTGRTVGLDDDGTFRYINLSAGMFDQVDVHIKYARDVQLLHETRDLVRAVAALSDDVGYRGTWLLGVHLNRLTGLISQLRDIGYSSQMSFETIYTAPDYSGSVRASSIELHQNPGELTARLMRGFLRGLGTEFLLSQPPFGQA